MNKFAKLKAVNRLLVKVAATPSGQPTSPKYGPLRKQWDKEPAWEYQGPGTLSQRPHPWGYPYIPSQAKKFYGKARKLQQKTGLRIPMQDGQGYAHPALRTKRQLRFMDKYMPAAIQDYASPISLEDLKYIKQQHQPATRLKAIQNSIRYPEVAHKVKAIQALRNMGDMFSPRGEYLKQPFVPKGTQNPIRMLGY